ncbi:ATP-binding protein [Nucisporomicrobium flavum]|uniref:ATP-binding protein n=1 Tax=Nucisporomicrobium flavum TaxID=2785915 RepID=UPI0018F299DC|nr:ATP-binding protein [Nucisporomicrobium flavum]
MVNAERTGFAPRRGTQNRPPRPASPRVLLDQEFHGGNLAALRTAVASLARDVADAGTAESVILVAHELSSNSVRHGGGSGRLRMWVAGRAVHCEISDHGAGLADPDGAGRELPSHAAPGGRGLWLARRMSDLHISTGDRGTTVTAVVAL